MTAPLATSSNIYTGTREIGQVTNTYAGYFQSSGAAYDLILPWPADKIEWFNYTKYATDSNNLQGVWFRDFPAAEALVIVRGSIELSSILEAANGVTNASTAGGFTNQHLVITNITTATPGVVTTSTAHGLTDGDRVVITQVIGTAASELNNNTYVVNVLSPTTFGLYDIYGLPVPVVGAYTSSGQVTKTGPELGVVDNPPSYIYTLGTAVVGSANDVIYFVAHKFNSYWNLGVIA